MGTILSHRLLGAAASIAAAAASSAAYAQGAEPAITGNGWIAIAVVAGLVVLIVLMIGGALSVSRRDKPEDDGAGFGVLESIDEDEEEEERRNKR